MENKPGDTKGKNETAKKPFTQSLEFWKALAVIGWVTALLIKYGLIFS